MGNLTDSIKIADDDYLIGISNRGIFNRAVKEFPDTVIELSIQPDVIKAKFQDGTECEIKNEIKNFTCTCPSKTICKHIMMVILKAREELTAVDDSEKAPEDIVYDYTELLELSPEQMLKSLGKKAFNDVVYKFNFGSKAEIEEKSILTIFLTDTGHTVKFPASSPLAGSICDCKSKDMCPHKAEAILHYMKYKNGSLGEGFTLQENVEGETLSLEAVPYIKKFLEEFIYVGLARIPGDYAEKFSQMATVCHGNQLPNMERICRRISGELNLYFSKNSNFSKDKLLSNIARLYGICTLLEKNPDNRALQDKLLGQFKSDYRQIPNIEFSGLGAGGWKSKSGYAGLTVYFYCDLLKSILTYTVSRPDTGKDGFIEGMYSSPAPWETNTAVKVLSHSKIQLSGGKLGERMQLSSSKEGRGTIKGEVNLSDTEISNIVFDDFAEVVKYLWEANDEQEGDNNLVLLIPERLDAGLFDKMNQEYKRTVYDKNNRKVTLNVKYSASGKRLIGNLEALEKENLTPKAIFAAVSLVEGALTAYPVSFYYDDGSKINLSLDNLEAKNPQKSKYF